MSPRPAHRGFTLLELTVVIAIIAILASSLVPIVVQPYLTERRAETVKEMAAIEEAIVGRPELGDYGFLGTMGRPPVNVLELLQKGTNADPSLIGGVVRGWVGPYLRVATPNPTKDGWGNDYVINNVLGSWNIQSLGPDGVASADDIFYPYDSATGWNAVVAELDVLGQYEPDTSTSVATTVATGTAARLVIADGVAGNWTYVDSTFAPSGYASFGPIPVGLHSITVGDPLTGPTRPVPALRPVSSATVLVPRTP